eukprot:gene22128-biopygen4198
MNVTFPVPPKLDVSTLSGTQRRPWRRAAPPPPPLQCRGGPSLQRRGGPTPAALHKRAPSAAKACLARYSVTGMDNFSGNWSQALPHTKENPTKT